MRMRGISAILLVLLAGCGPRSEDVEPPKADWIIESHVVFVEPDGKTPRSTPSQAMRLWMPYLVGDIYGSPNAGELVPVDLRPDLAFTLNLNKRHLTLERALEPTQFSQKWMIIEPKDARVARLMPFVLPQEGIVPFGIAEWLDTDSGAKLMLVYVDRPARIRGEVVYEGRSLRFDIDAKEPGFQWIRQPEGSGVYEPVPRPRNLVLAVMPS